MRRIGDSFEILKEFNDNAFDIVLTDPPYSLDTKEQIWLHQEFERLSRGTIIVFSPPENQWTPPPWVNPPQILFWVKPISTKNTSRRYSRFVEMIFVYSDNPNHWHPGRHWSQYTNVFTDLVDNSKLHPFRKPPSLIERLILNHTKPDQYILDPFAGSGVVEEVAARLGRDCYSIEIEP